MSNIICLLPLTTLHILFLNKVPLGQPEGEGLTAEVDGDVIRFAGIWPSIKVLDTLKFDPWVALNERSGDQSNVSST